jgi:hypothetical protein
MARITMWKMTVPIPRRHSRRPAAFAAIVSLALGAWATPGFAEDEGPEALIRQGVALRRNGEESKAYGYFRRAYETAPTPRSTAQYGLSSVAVGKYAEAEWLLSAAIASGDPWTMEHGAELQKGRIMARGKLGTVILAGVPPDATIALGGRTVGHLAADRAVRWTPGATRVHLEAAGHEPYDGEVTFPAPGREGRLTVSMRSVNEPAATTPVAPVPAQPVAVADPPAAVPVDAHHDEKIASRDEPGTPTSGWRRPVIWTALGLGAASVAFGVFETIQYRSKINDFNDPTRMPLCRDGGGMIAGGSECSRLASDGDHAKTLSIVGYAAGGALLAAGVILLLTDTSAPAATSVTRGDGSRAGTGRDRRFREGLTMDCAPGLGSVGGASCRVRF